MVARTAFAALLSLFIAGASASAQNDSRASGADALIAEIATSIASVDNKRESARADEEDATLYNCLNEKYLNMAAYELLANEALERYSNASGEAARGDALDLIQTAHGRVLALKAEADLCESDVINYAGPQDRSADQDPAIPDRDTTSTGQATSPTGAADTTDDSDSRNTPIL